MSPGLRVVARWNRSADGRSNFVVGSLAAHGALVLALVAWPGWRGRPLSNEPAIGVTLLAPDHGTVGSRPVPPAPRPPEPPVKQPEPARPPEPKTAPQEVRPAPVKKRAETPRPAPPTPPARETPDGPTGPTSGGSAPSGGPATPSGSVDLAGMGAEYDWYRDAVMRALHASWKQPFLPDNTTVLEVVVVFEILRNGAVRGVRIDASSGVPALDRSALRAVADATLPPLPREFSEPTQPARIIFRLDPES